MQYMLTSDDCREKAQYRKVRIRWMCPDILYGWLKKVSDKIAFEQNEEKRDM